MSTVRNLVAIAKGGKTSAGAGGAAATTGTLNWTCPSSLPSTVHKKEKKKRENGPAPPLGKECPAAQC